MDETVGEVEVDGQTYPIELKPTGLELRIGDQVAVLNGKVKDKVASLVHTEVPQALRGKGIAEAMTRAALDYARAHEWTVKPYCPFVAKYIEKNPEYKDLIDPAFAP